MILFFLILELVLQLIFGLHLIVELLLQLMSLLLQLIAGEGGEGEAQETEMKRQRRYKKDH